MIPIIGTLVGKALTIVDQFVPDKDKAADIKFELSKLYNDAELQLAMKQMEINIADAKKKNFTWRDLVGYICAAALGFNFIVFPLINIFLQVPIPPLEMAQLMPILMGILGLGAARSFDKKNGSR